MYIKWRTAGAIAMAAGLSAGLLTGCGGAKHGIRLGALVSDLFSGKTGRTAAEQEEIIETDDAETESTASAVTGESSTSFGVQVFPEQTAEDTVSEGETEKTEKEDPETVISTTAVQTTAAETTAVETSAASASYDPDLAASLAASADYMYVDQNAADGSIVALYYVIPQDGSYAVKNLYGDIQAVIPYSDCKTLVDQAFLSPSEGNTLPVTGGRGVLVWNSPYGLCKYDHTAADYTNGSELKYTLTESAVQAYIDSLNLPDGVRVPDSARQN